MSGLTREVLVERLAKLQEGHRTASRSVEQLFGAISQCELFIKMLDTQAALVPVEPDVDEHKVLQFIPSEDTDDA